MRNRRCPVCGWHVIRDGRCAWCKADVNGVRSRLELIRREPTVLDSLDLSDRARRLLGE